VDQADDPTIENVVEDPKDDPAQEKA